ncbi:hypothetical protein [Streptomyces sp. C3-3]|uniref:hypothetical protein n=1 Tax=Streptomyces sp. C3-3 TaxID=2824901 RepID=UPI001B399703|nr:hypothetical protein [Streptomyces sp. C3-3]MBQ1118373.1 hypothetical protein [Streptomyces sp. C3-3]
MAIPGNMLSAATESMDPTYTGWRPRLNCSLTSGTGGRNGPKTLVVKSTAAGETQAETVTGYSVTAGQTYQVFADSSSATEVERIGLEWLDATYTPVGSLLWSLPTATASASWHRVGVAGVAPAGATRVRVVLSSTAAGAAVSHSWENVYLGVPLRTTGNLFSFNTESPEIDATAWTAGTNTTVGRQAPMVSWAADWYWAGAQVLTLTATGSGTVSATTVETPVVTPGVEYLGYCYLAPPTTGSSAWVELRYYDGSGSQLSATRGTLAPASTGYQRQRVSAFAPAGAVTCRLAVGMDSATAAQVLRVEQAVVTAAPAMRAGTVLPYADASFEQGVAGWTKTSGVATIARSTPWGTYALDGSYALTVSSATATASTLRSARFPLPAGSGGLGFRVQFGEVVTAGGWTTTRGIRWYDAANTDLGLTTAAAAAVPAPNWWLLSSDQTAPAGATQAAVELTLTATTTSSTIQLDRVALWQALPLITSVPQATSASITVTLRELDIGDLITVYRVTADGKRTLVRGPNGLLDGSVTVTSDLMVIEDYEAPLLTPVSYRVEFLDPVTGGVQTRTASQVTVPHPDVNEAWLKDPGAPQRNTKVLVKTAPNWQRAVEQAAYRVAGRRNAVVLSDVRGGLEGELVVWTRTDNERAALHWLLDPGHVLLWQAAPGMGVSDMYVSVGQVTEGRVGGPATEPWREWSLPLTEVDMPTTVGVGGSAGRTWRDILTEFASWEAVRDEYATWEDVFLDRRIGG